MMWVLTNKKYIHRASLKIATSDIKSHRFTTAGVNIYDLSKSLKEFFNLAKVYGFFGCLPELQSDEEEMWCIMKDWWLSGESLYSD